MAANGVRALDALGVGAAVRQAARPQYTGGLRTPDGRWLGRIDGAALERAMGTPIVAIPRAALHQVLRAALPPESLVTAAEVTSVDQYGPDRVRVEYAGTAAEADLVVAADGIGSRLRAQLFPTHPGPAYSGATILRALTEHPIRLATDFELTWGPGVEFGHIAFADGRAEWHAVLDSPAGVRYPEPLAELKRRFSGWHDPIPGLLDATRPEAVLHYDIRELATPLPAYTVGRVAILGDAAHAMPPDLGQGACQALEDAATLAAALAGESGTDSALARYDAERRPRSQSVAKAARQAGRMGHRLTHPLAIALRNTLLRATPSRVTVRTTLRHAHWTPPHLGEPRPVIR